MTLRPFVAWDGEAVKGDDNYHPYCLFGSSLGWRVKAPDLTTLDCLSLLIETEIACPEAIHFGFAFGYDVNMILKDLPIAALNLLRRYGKCRFMGFNLEYIPHKWLRVSYGRGKGRTTLQVFDTFSFFQKGLGPTLRKYGIGSSEQLDRIDAGKGERPNFTFDDLSSYIEPYWETELSLMVRLMDEFRGILENAGIHISSWHGPGAIANYLLRTHGSNLHMDRGLPDEIIRAAQSAYFGGRFEPFVAGFYDGPVYSADINSAYPYSHSRLPSLAEGKWVPGVGKPEHTPADVRVGLYHIRYTGKYSNRAMPLPHRDPDGSVSFSPATEGWFHAAEAMLVYDDPRAEFLDYYVYEDDGDYPFAWIEEEYEKRLEMQRIGDSTERAYKLGINSLYGRVAQRAGWERTGDAPKWHQLEWAGAITSECRAMVYQVARGAGKHLVSIDTDGVLSLRPFSSLPNGAGNRLGQWKVTQYSGMLYVQNGIYWLRDEAGNWLPPKSRGIPRRKLAFDAVYPILARGEDLEISQHMFIGFGLALRGRMHDWRKWLDEPRVISFGGNGKRIHASRMCGACLRGLGRVEGLHSLTPVPPRQFESALHKLPWRDAASPVPIVEESDESVLLLPGDNVADDRSVLEVRRELMAQEKWGIFE